MNPWHSPNPSSPTSPHRHKGTSKPLAVPIEKVGVAIVDDGDDATNPASEAESIDPTPSCEECNGSGGPSGGASSGGSGGGGFGGGGFGGLGGSGSGCATCSEDASPGMASWKVTGPHMNLWILDRPM